MNDSTTLIEAHELRILALEHRYRRVLAFAVLIALAFLWRELSPAQHEIRASRYTLLDQNGKDRGMWRVQDGVAALVLRDESGSWRAMLAVGAEGTNVPGSRLEVSNEDGSLVALTTEGGTPGLRVWDDADGAARIRVETTRGAPYIELLGQEGQSARVRPRTEARQAPEPR